MASEHDIYISAQVLIREHGDDALAYAFGRADELLDRGEADGASLMLRIVVAIEALEAPPESVH